MNSHNIVVRSVACLVLLAVALMPLSAGAASPWLGLGWPALKAPSTLTLPALLVLNPSTVSPGQAFSVEGFGFPPGQTYELSVVAGNGKVIFLGRIQVDDAGRLANTVSEIPASQVSGSFQVVAQNADSHESLAAAGYVQTRLPSISLSTTVGKAGDAVLVSATGFAPQESVLAYLNRLAGEPFATFTADEWGTVGESFAVMPYGPTGENTIILVGGDSRIPVTASFIMIGFFPTVALSNYAPKGDESMGFSGSAFGPFEQVRVHFNTLTSPPVKTVTTDGSGAFEEPNGYDVPFGLKGKQNLIFAGESSGAVLPVTFEAMPYSPSIEPSTWSGRPGTSITFYGTGFARNELVRVYRTATPGNPAVEASCFTTDRNGEVGGLGSYTIQAGDEVGDLKLELSTEKSQVSLPVSIQILPAIGDLPPGVVPPNLGCNPVRSDR